MPARAPTSDLGLPALLARLGGFPEGEVESILLIILVGIHAPAAADSIAFQLDLRKPPVLLEGRYPEIGRALGLIGEIVRAQPLDQLHHLRNVLRGFQDSVRALHTQR